MQDRPKIIQQVEERVHHNQVQKGYDELMHYIKHNSYTIDLLLLKMKLEEKLQRNENSLKTCNFILFINPTCQEAHIMKINLYKKLQQYTNISDQLLIIKRLFPNVNLMQIQ